MARIKTESQYEHLMARIEEIIKAESNEEKTPAHILAELDVLGELVEEYEIEHYPVLLPSLGDLLRLRMAEYNLTQKDAAKKIGVSPSRVSEYMAGKAKPTYHAARKMVTELGLSPAMVLEL
jgi:HTH-type transcriptional regulator/antitoxin HigA